MEKTIFKVGDEVYYHNNNSGLIKGKVTNIIGSWENISHPIVVNFENGRQGNFDEIGRIYGESIPTLSFAPYDFVNGGFTQEMPLPKIEVDTLVYVKFHAYDNWCMRFFSHFKNGKMYVFRDQLKSTETEEEIEVLEWSLTNPLEK